MTDKGKRAAAEKALSLIEPDMKLGLGSGSTAELFVTALGAKVRAEGLKLDCVATSKRTAALAEAQGLKLVALDDAGWLDLTIDGADEIDGDLTLIKGGGGALLVEKIVATASDRMVVIADASKKVARLGRFPLPVEVVPFGWRTTRALIEELLSGFEVGGRAATLRMAGDRPFVTDEGHHLLDLALERIGDPAELAFALNAVPGVVDTGLFVGVADAAILGRPDGAIEAMVAPERE